MPGAPYQLERQLSEWESDEALLQPAQFARRMEILDQLDTLLPDAGFGNCGPSTLLTRARALVASLDSANAELYDAIREQIKNGICPAEFLPFLHNASSNAPSGLAYDYADDLISGIFQFETPANEPCALGPESVFYQPTPARHIFHLIAAAVITPADILVDLGSGLGHVPLLASICSGAFAMGIELEPTWVAIAKNCARSLNLRNVTFFAQDARDADLSAGTVFYLYTPFTGPTLASVIESLRKQAWQRPIRICTFGPCAFAFSEQRWLKPTSPPATDQVTIFFPRA
jgi:hypothetical protein